MDITAACCTSTRNEICGTTYAGFTLAADDPHLATDARDSGSATKQDTAAALASSTHYVHAATNAPSRRTSRNLNSATTFAANTGAQLESTANIALPRCEQSRPTRLDLVHCSACL
jgi:hypothetical protein